MPSELNLIKQFRCTTCGARAMASCRKLNGENKIYPYAPGSSSEEWVHVSRRNAALRAGVITEPRRGFTASMVRKIRGG